MPLDLKGLFSKDKLVEAGAKLVDSIGGALDKTFTNKEEREAAKLAITQEVNRHVEALEAQRNEMEKAYLTDTANARTRENEFVKATGHIDWFMLIFGSVILLLFCYTVWVSSGGSIPLDMREIFIESRAAVRDIILAIAAYYWGSSAGSRIKDMKK